MYSPEVLDITISGQEEAKASLTDALERIGCSSVADTDLSPEGAAGDENGGERIHILCASRERRREQASEIMRYKDELRVPLLLLFRPGEEELLNSIDTDGLQFFLFSPYSDTELKARLNEAVRLHQRNMNLDRETDRLESVLEMMPDIVYRVDRNGKITYINRAIERYGYKKAEVIGKEIFEIFQTEEISQIEYNLKEKRTGLRKTRLMEASFPYRNTYPVPVQLRRKNVNGSSVFLIDAEGIYSRGEGDQKEFIGTQGIARDISDRKTAENELIIREEKYRSIFEMVGDALIVLEEEDASVVDLNAAANDILCYGPGELIGKCAINLVAKKDRARILEEWKTRAERGDVVRVETGFIRKDGSEGTALLSSRKVTVNDNTFVFVVGQDISDRKKSEVSLKESEHLYRQMFEGHEMINMLIDPETGKIVDANTSAHRFYGYPPRKLNKMRIQQLSTASEHETENRINHVLKNNIGSFSSVHILADGSFRFTLVYASVIERKGSKLIFITVIDQSELLNAQRQIELSRDIYIRMSKEDSIEGTFSVLLSELYTLEEFDSGMIIRISDSGRAYEAADTKNLSKTFVEQELLLHPLLTKTHYRRIIDVGGFSYHKIKNMENAEHYKEEGILSAAVVPLNVNEMLLGVMQLYSHSSKKVSEVSRDALKDILSATENIIAKLLTQEALWESEQRFRELADNLDIAFWLRDARKNHVIYVSPAFEAIYNRPLQDYYNDPDLWFRMIHPEDKLRISEQLKKVEKTASTILEYRLLLPGGRVRWVQNTFFPLRDKEERVVRYAGFVEDISHKKYHEERINRINKCLLDLGSNYFDNLANIVKTAGELLQGMYAVYCRKEEGGYNPVAYWNIPEKYQEKEKWNRVDFENIIPESKEYAYLKDIHSAAGIESNELISRCGIRGGFMRLVKFANKKNGILCVFYDQDVDFSDEDIEIAGIVCAALGIEEERREIHKELEEAKINAELANNTKNDFLASMSHELRTPLHGILGYAHILKRAEDLKHSQIEDITTIERMGSHLLHMINDILDFSKIEAQRMEPVLESINLKIFFRDIVRVMGLKAQEKGLDLLTEFAADLPVHFQTDEKLLRQVLFNIIGNAIKFTQSGSIHFAVRRSAECIRFIVKDTGPGIPDEMMEKIFNPFTQIKRDDGKADGAGLGLAISKKILSLFDSRLHVESTMDVGSSFYFDLPVSEVQDRKGVSSGIEEEITGYRGDRKKILIAEDRLDSRILLYEMLSPLGFIVFTAENGDEVMEIVDKERPDMLFIDLFITGRRGTDIVQTLSKERKYAELKIVALSAGDPQASRQMSREAGCSSCIIKPFGLKDLLDIVGRELELEWLTRKTEDQVSIADAESLTVPDTAVLEALWDYAAIGDVFALEQEIKKIQQTNPETADFCSYVTEMAQAFNIEEIKNIIKTHLGGGE